MQTKKVNEAIEVLTSMCASKWLIDQIKDQKLSISVGVLPGNTGASYEFGTGLIKISAPSFDQCDAEGFAYLMAHEFYHAYQDKVYYNWGQTGTKTFMENNGKVNIEFEAYTFDIRLPKRRACTEKCSTTSYWSSVGERVYNRY